MGDDEAQTFDISVEDVTPEELAALVGGIGYMAALALSNGAFDQADAWSGLQIRLMTENREAVRHMVLESEAGEFMEAHHYEEEVVMEELGLEVVKGEIYDAESESVEIDVE